jgi:lipid-A-disaccharide synthase-like uncharacterized protein
MDWLTNLFWHEGKFLGIDWTFWNVFWNFIGWSGNAVFSSRVLVQWYAAEKKKQVVVPSLFWWLSLAGSLLLLSFAVFYDKHYVVIFAYAFNWIPYTRNLIIHRRHKEAHIACPGCGNSCPPQSNFCSSCGASLAPLGASVPR